MTTEVVARDDANCLVCRYKNGCGISINMNYDQNGKPNMSCYGYVQIAEDRITYLLNGIDRKNPTE